MTIVVAPSALNEVSWVTPGICANCRSSGAATDEAMVSALAPWKLAVTWIVGKSTCGKRGDRQERKGDQADEGQRRHQQRGGDRPADEWFGDVHELLPDAAVGGEVTATGALRWSLYCPSVTIAFTAVETRGDDGQILVGGADLDRTRLRQVVAGDGPDEQAIGSALDGARGNDDGVAAGVEQHVRVDELARPQLLVVVGEHRLELDGGGGLVDDVVDQEELAGGERTAVVLIVGDHLHRTARHGVADVVEGARRQGEQDGGGSRQHQRRERCLVVGMDDVSGIDQAHADATVARRGDGGVFELRLRGLDRGVVGRDRGLELIDLGLLLVDDLLRGDVREHQRLRAREVLLGRGELGLVLRLLGLGLVERGLEQARVDLRQHVAFLDVLAFGEQHLLQLAVDLGVDRHGERRLHGPEPGQIDRHVLAIDDGDAHRHARSHGGTRGVRRSRALHAVPVDRAARRQDRKESNDQNQTTAAA